LACVSKSSGVIYESRPNVTADAGALCLKVGNAVILRGGRMRELGKTGSLRERYRAAIAAGGAGRRVADHDGSGAGPPAASEAHS